MNIIATIAAVAGSEDLNVVVSSPTLVSAYSGLYVVGLLRRDSRQRVGLLRRDSREG